MSLKSESESLRLLAQELERQARNKFYNFYAGLSSYFNADVPEWQPKAKLVWQDGSTKIWDYAEGKRGKTILFVSPLINRANILDLKKNSFMQFLKEQGYKPLLVDWGQPTSLEKSFDSDDYVARLKKFCDLQKGEIIIGGYCMGGLLALKLAKLVKHKALVLLATPWNFDAPDVNKIKVQENVMRNYLRQFEFIPQEVIQSLFITADPWRVYNKYSNYKPEYNEVEHWVNNGVNMSVNLAEEAIIDWSINNATAKGKWLNTDGIETKTFLACPTKDKIVPIGCSVPLAGVLPNSDLFKFSCGHVGLIWHEQMRQSLANWLKQLR